MIIWKKDAKRMWMFSFFLLFLEIRTQDDEKGKGVFKWKMQRWNVCRFGTRKIMKTLSDSKKTKNHTQTQSFFLSSSVSISHLIYTYKCISITIGSSFSFSFLFLLRSCWLIFKEDNACVVWWFVQNKGFLFSLFPWKLHPFL